MRERTAQEGHLKQRRRIRLATIATAFAASAVLLALPVGRTSEAQAASVTAAPESAFERSLRPFYPDIAKALVINGVIDPDLKNANAEQMAAALATNGLQRLDDNSALRLLALRADMARRADAGVCARMWSRMYGDSLARQIGLLPEQREWAEIFHRAALAIVRGDAPVPAPPPSRTEEAMKQLLPGAAILFEKLRAVVILAMRFRSGSSDPVACSEYPFIDCNDVTGLYRRLSLCIDLAFLA
jgi:hypothetical protein